MTIKGIARYIQDTQFMAEPSFDQTIVNTTRRILGHDCNPLCP